MDPQVRKIFIIAVAVLVLLNIGYLFWRSTDAGAGELQQNREKYDADRAAFEKLEGTAIVWWGEKEKGSFEKLKRAAASAQGYTRSVYKDFKDWDTEFETLPNDDKFEGYVTFFRDNVKGNTLLALPYEVGILKDNATKIFEEIDESASLLPKNEYEIQATHKKIRILQYIIYVLLKPADPENPFSPLVMELMPGTSAPAINIVLKASDQQKRTEEKNPQVFYEIEAEFKVKIDGKNLPRLLKELASYTPHSAADPASIPIGLKDDEGEFKPFVKKLGTDAACSPLTSLIFRINRLSISPAGNAEILEKTEIETKSSDMKEMLKAVAKFDRPLVVSINLSVLDYNQNRGVNKARTPSKRKKK